MPSLGSVKYYSLAQAAQGRTQTNFFKAIMAGPHENSFLGFQVMLLTDKHANPNLRRNLYPDGVRPSSSPNISWNFCWYRSPHDPPSTRKKIDNQSCIRTVNKNIPKYFQFFLVWCPAYPQNVMKIQNGTTSTLPPQNKKDKNVTRW